MPRWEVSIHDRYATYATVMAEDEREARDKLVALIELGLLEPEFVDTHSWEAEEVEDDDRLYPLTKVE